MTDNRRKSKLDKLILDMINYCQCSIHCQYCSYVAMCDAACVKTEPSGMILQEIKTLLMEDV